MVRLSEIYKALKKKFPRKNKTEICNMAYYIGERDYNLKPSDYDLEEFFAKKNNISSINHKYDDIVENCRGRYIYGTFKCKRCGKTRHNGYKYKGYINICMTCKSHICGKSGNSVWAIYTPMK